VLRYLRSRAIADLGTLNAMLADCEYLPPSGATLADISCLEAIAENEAGGRGRTELDRAEVAAYVGAGEVALVGRRAEGLPAFVDRDAEGACKLIKQRVARQSSAATSVGRFSAASSTKPAAGPNLRIRSPCTSFSTIQQNGRKGE
jgi:hypothetical protein